MRRVLIVVLAVMCLSIAGCSGRAAESTPQIAPTTLTDSQQEIVDLIVTTGQEVMFFEYSLGGAFNDMEVWVDVYHYGELVGTLTSLRIFGDVAMPLNDGVMAITIHNHNRNEFQWAISNRGGRISGASWTAAHEYMARAFGPITEAVPITNGEEIILYVSRFTTGSTLRTHGDHQYYLNNPEILAQYTYVHMIKARFLAN